MSNARVILFGHLSVVQIERALATVPGVAEAAFLRSPGPSFHVFRAVAQTNECEADTRIVRMFTDSSCAGDYADVYTGASTLITVYNDALGSAVARTLAEAFGGFYQGDDSGDGWTRVEGRNQIALSPEDVLATRLMSAFGFAAYPQIRELVADPAKLAAMQAALTEYQSAVAAKG